MVWLQARWQDGSTVSDRRANHSLVHESTLPSCMRLQHGHRELWASQKLYKTDMKCQHERQKQQKGWSNNG